MRLLTLVVPAAALFIGTACADGDVGILTVHVSLHPVAVDIPTEFADSIDAGSFAAGVGSLHTDVPTGTGSVDASELPELPDGLVYVPMLTFASSARAGLPASGSAEGGHGHGVSDGGDEPASDDEEGHDEDPADEGGGSIIGDALAPADHDSYVGVFSEADIGEFELGALRSGMVLIASEDGSPLTAEVDMIPILAGEVDFEGEGSSAGGPAAEEEEGGHAHGV